MAYDLRSGLMISWLTHRGWRWRIPVLACILTVTLISAIYFFLHFHLVDNQLRVWFPRQDPALESYQHYIQEFGTDRVILIAFEVGDVFAPEAWQFARALTHELETMPEIATIHHVFNSPVIGETPDAISIRPLLADLPMDPTTWTQVRSRALSDPLIRGRLTSTDAAIMIFHLVLTPDYQLSVTTPLLERISSIVYRLNQQDWSFAVSGTPVLENHFNDRVMRDQRVLFPLSLIVVFLTIMCFLRSFSDALRAILPQIVVLSLILALFVWLDLKMNLVSGLVCAILLCVTVTDAIHILWEFRRHAPSREAMMHTLRKILAPIYFTSLTTMLGFLCLVSSSIPPLKQLGLFSALAVGLALFLTIMMIPWLIRYREGGATPAPSKLSLWFMRWAPLITHYRNHLLTILSVTILLYIGLGIGRLHTETNLFEYFRHDDPIKQDLDFLEENIGGVMTVEVLISSPHANQPVGKDPRVLRALDDFTRHAKQIADIRSVQSVIDYIKPLYAASQSGKTDIPIPTEPAGLAQLYFMMQSMGELGLQRWVNQDYTALHATLHLTSLPSTQLGRIIEAIRNGLETRMHPLGVEVTLTGFAPLMVWLDQRIMESQLKSLGLALLVITIIMAIAFRSPRMGLISMIPNVFPILMTLATMGLFGIPLNVTTVMIAAIVIGISVDDTIYYIHRYQQGIGQGLGPAGALDLAYTEVGPPIVFTSVVLMVGFSVLLFGSFTPTIYFGLMTALTFGFALFGALVLLPLLLVRFTTQHPHRFDKHDKG